MTWDRNRSPHGWYVGSYLLRCLEQGVKGNQDVKRRFLTWENTVLVKARSLDHAYDKVCAVGKSQAGPFKGGQHGVSFKWTFEGVTELLPIYEELVDGAEIMWAEHAPRTLKRIREQIKKKRDFVQ